MGTIFIRWIDRQHWIETILYKVILAWVERESCFSQLRYLSSLPSSCTRKQGQKLSKMKAFFKEKIIQSFKDCFSFSGGSRGGARGARPPYFQTKLRPEGPKKFFETAPPPLISRCGSGTVIHLYAFFRQGERS